MGLRHQRMNRQKFTKDDLIVWVLRLVFIAAILFLFWSQNNLVLVRNYVFSSPDLPKIFTGYKIVHVSDICNSSISIYNKVKKCEPNIIVVSGGYEDINGKYDNSVKTINELSKIAPVYYVYGLNDSTDSLAGSNGINLTNSVVELKVSAVSAEEFIKDIYGNSILKAADNGDEESQQYIEYIKSVLVEQADTTVGLIGLDRNSGDNGPEQALNQAYDLLSKTESTYTMGVVGTAKTIPEVSNSRLRLAFTGGTYGTKTISDVYTKGHYGIKQVQTFFCGGLGTGFKDDKKIMRIFNFPEIQCITLSDGTIKEQNPLEKLLAYIWGDVGNIFEDDGGFEVYKYSGDELKNK